MKTFLAFIGALLVAASVQAAPAPAIRTINEGRPSTNDTIMVDTTNVRVGIGTSTPSYPLDVYGDVRSTGQYIGNSANFKSLEIQTGVYKTTLDTDGQVADIRYVLPSTSGVSGQRLVTDGEGGLSWAFQPVAGRQEYYLTGIPGDFGYTLMVTSVTAQAYTASTKTVTASDIVVSSFITPVGYPSPSRFLPIGTWTTRIHGYLQGPLVSVKSLQIYAKFYEVMPDGSETLIGRSDTSVPFSDTPAGYNLSLSTGPITLVEGSRIGVKYYTLLSGSGTNPTLYATRGAQYTSNVSITGPTVDTNLFVPYNGATESLFMGAHNVTATNYYGNGSNLTGLVTSTAAIASRLAAAEAALSTAVFTTASYADPSWITSVATSKIDLSTVTTAISAMVPYTGADRAVNMGAYGVNSSSQINASVFGLDGVTVMKKLSATSFAVGLGQGANQKVGNTHNIFIGDGGTSAGIASNNVSVGNAALSSLTGGASNAILGHAAGMLVNTGGWNSIVGAWAGQGITNKNFNAIVGFQAGGNSMFAGPDNNNTLIGAYAGWKVTGSSNTMVGMDAGNDVTSGSRNIIIGDGEDAPTATTNDYLNIGGAIVGDLASSSVTVNSMLTTNTLLVGTTLQQGYGVVISTPVKFVGDGIYWDDLRTPLISAAGGTVRPAILKSFRKDLAGTSDGVYANAFENQSVVTNEQELFFTTQMPHRWKLGTPVDPHVHYAVTASSSPGVSDTIVFGLEYSCGGLTGQFPVTNVTHSTSTVPSPYYIGYLDFEDITIPAEISSVCAFRLFRNSSSATDNFAGDVFALEADLHFEADTLGSRYEAQK